LTQYDEDGRCISCGGRANPLDPIGYVHHSDRCELTRQRLREEIAALEIRLATLHSRLRE
jgi:hypothetical protein